MDYQLSGDVLVMRCAEGFYLIDALAGIPLRKQARDQGEINAHILRVEAIGGEVLWTRPAEILEADVGI